MLPSTFEVFGAVPFYLTAMYLPSFSSRRTCATFGYLGARSFAADISALSSIRSDTELSTTMHLTPSFPAVLSR